GVERRALVRQVRRPAAREARPPRRSEEAPHLREVRNGLRDHLEDFEMAQDKDDEKEKGGAAKAGGKPQLTPEQEAEAAAKKAARAEAKAKGGKVPKGKAAAAAKEVAMERVKRDGPARLRKLYDAE